MDSDEARRLDREGPLGQAVAAWRSVVRDDPDEGRNRVALGEALFRLGEKRFLVERKLAIGAPPLGESATLNASAWHARNGEAALRQRGIAALEASGGVRARLARPDDEPYEAVLAFLVESWWPFLFRFPRGELAEEGARLTALPEAERAQPMAQCELAVVDALGGDFEGSRRALEELVASGRRVPIGFDPHAFAEFVNCLADPAGAWSHAVAIDDPTAYRDAGFSAWEARVWAARFPSAGVARPWWESGMAAAEAELWHGKGIEPADVVAWRRARFDPAAAGPWREVGVEPEVAAAWRAAGVAAEAAEGWVAAGFDAAEVGKLQNNIWHRFTVDEARGWSELGLGAAEILGWFERGVVEPSAAAAQMAGSAASNGPPAEELAVWRGCGFDRVDYELWGPTGVSAAEARDWRSRGFEPREAAAWVASEMSAAAAQRWRHLPHRPTVAAALERDGVPPAHSETFLDDEVRAAWKRTGVGFAEAARFLRFGFGPEAAALWHAVGADWAGARTLQAAGVEASNLPAWLEAGIDEPHAIVNWRRSGFEPSAAASWRDAGFGNADARLLADAGGTPAEATRLKEAGVPPVVAQYWLRAGFDAEGALAARAAGLTEGAVRNAVASGLSDVPSWLAVGFPVKSAFVEWARSGWQADEAYRWWRRFYLPPAAKRARDAAVVPEESVPWDRATPGWHAALPEVILEAQRGQGADPSVAVEAWVNEFYAEAFDSLAEAAPWILAGVFDDGHVAAAWRRDGFAVATASRWVAVGYTSPERVQDALAEGVSLESLEARQRPS